MKSSESIAKIAAALAAARAKIAPVTKDATNPHFRNSYASLEAISAAATPVLLANGIVVAQSATMFDEGALTVETRLIHTSGEWIEGGITLPLGKSDPQGAGSAVSYGRRYGLSAILGLVTEEDDDGNAASARPAAAPAKSAAPKASAPTTGATSNSPAAKKMPFGRNKGTPLGDLPDDELQRTLDWIAKTQSESGDHTKFAELAADIVRVLDDRHAPAMTTGDSDDELAF